MVDNPVVSTDNQPEIPAEIKSTANHIQLLELRVDAFAGIDPSRNLIIQLHDKPIVGFEGDQGVGKTSLLECLIAHLGGDEAKNSTHVSIKDAKDKDGKTTKVIEKQRKSALTFKDKRTPNVTYEIKIGKSSTTIKKIEDVDGTIISGNVDSPKTFLWNTFGPIGISPMTLKDMDGKKQIDWIRNLYKFTPAQLKEEEVLKVKYATKFKERTGVNNDVGRLFKEVNDTGYFIYEKENHVFLASTNKEIDEKFVADNNEDEAAINSMFDKASSDMQQLTAANTRLDQRKVEKQNIEKEIKNLEQKLADEREKLIAKEVEIKTGTEYVDKLKDAPVQLEAIKNKMQRVSEVKLKKQNIATAIIKVKEYEEKQDKQIQLNADLDELKIQRKNFIKQFTPDIPGLELIVNDGIDNQKEEGMYFNDHTPREMSESELWDLFMQILRAVKCYFICIENISSLGSSAIERLNWFVKEGHGTVFYTAMQRGQKEMKVTLNTEIPV